MCKLRLERVIFDDISTIGDLYVNDEFYCNTLEDKYRGELTDASQKVYGQTAINCAIYKVVFTISKHFNNKLMPELLNVLCFTGVRLHSGNKAEDTEGCILCGLYDENKPDWISESKDKLLN